MSNNAQVLLLMIPFCAVVYGLAALWLHFGRCPSCGRYTLRMTDFVYADTLSGPNRGSDHWAIYRCKNCAARWRWHRGQWKQAA